MKLQDLRLGNWVIDKFDKRNIHECQIELDDFAAIINFGGSPNVMYKPIILNKEWYDKIKDNTHEGVCFSNRDSKFYIVIDAGDFEAAWVEIKFVHKAQNLWYELTEGSELTIKENV